MKPNTQTLHLRRHDIVSVPCCYCKRPLLRVKSYLKKHPLSFCSEMCKVYYKDPKQAQIMTHINNPNFYYLIGLIATDGHIKYPNATKSAKTYEAMIRLKEEKDEEEILLQIQMIFGGTVYKEECNGFYSAKTICWRTSNKDFVQYLMDIGLTHNKTYTLNINNWFITLSKESQQAFVRGCWDGDGSINIYQRKTHFSKTTTNYICSASKPFINTIAEYFNPTRGIIHERQKEERDHLKTKATCSLYYFYLNGKASLELEKLYLSLNTQNDLYLKRKFLNWQKIKEYYCQ